MQKNFVALICAIVIAQVCAANPLKIENAASTDGKYVLEAVATSGDACRVDVKSKADGKIGKRIPVKDFDTDDQRYSISAVWKEDSAAFALNITKGPHITYCRVFVEDHGSWKEARLPEKQITKLRKESNTEGGKAVDYLLVTDWLPKDEIKFSYTGDAEVEYEMVGHLARAERPRLDFVKIIPPKPEPEPKYDYENYVFGLLEGELKEAKTARARLRSSNGRTDCQLMALEMCSSQIEVMILFGRSAAMGL